VCDGVQQKDWIHRFITDKTANCKHHTHAHTGIGAQSFYRLSSMVKEYTIQLYIYVNMHA
jgi:hypothetical protein